MKLTENCGYSWWSHPVALTKKNTNKILFGGVLDSGNPRAFSKKAWDTTVYDVSREDLMQGFEPDDHNSVVTISQNNRDLMFWSRHGKDNKVYMFERNANGVLSSLGGIDYPSTVTYVQVLEHGNRLLLLNRVSSNKWYYCVSDDAGESWGTPQVFFEDSTLQESEQVYATTAPTNVDGIYAMAIYGHPTSSAWREVVYTTLDVGALTVQDTNNQSYDVTLNPINKNTLEVAYTPDSNKAGEKVRLLDVSKKHGHDIILLAKWNDNTQTPQYYIYYKDTLTSGSWQSYKICSSGGVFDDGGGRKYTYGMCLDRDYRNPLKQDHHLYLIHKTGSSYYLKRYTLEPDMSLTDEKTLDTSTVTLARPYAPINADGVIYQVLNKYNNYTDYKIEIRYAG